MRSAYSSTPPRADLMSKRWRSSGSGGFRRWGVSGYPIHRNPHPSDALALARFSREVAAIKPDVVHGHGSKGGLNARLPGLLHPKHGPVRAYTPHGGSFNYHPGGLAHRRLSWAAEKRLNRMLTDVFLFESAYIAGRFDALRGRRSRRSDASSPMASAPPSLCAGAASTRTPPTSFYVGELREAKGIDTFARRRSRSRVQEARRAAGARFWSGPDRTRTFCSPARRVWASRSTSHFLDLCPSARRLSSGV